MDSCSITIRLQRPGGHEHIAYIVTPSVSCIYIVNKTATYSQAQKRRWGLITISYGWIDVIKCNYPWYIAAKCQIDDTIPNTLSFLKLTLFYLKFEPIKRNVLFCLFGQRLKWGENGIFLSNSLKIIKINVQMPAEHNWFSELATRSYLILRFRKAESNSRLYLFMGRNRSLKVAIFLHKLVKKNVGYKTNIVLTMID